MASTSDMIRKSLSHAEELTGEAENWKSISEEGGVLQSAMDESMTRVAGYRSEGEGDGNEAMVSADTAHP